MSMQQQQHISPDEYLQKYDLNKILQDALNASYQSKSSAPVSYLASYFRERNAVNAIQSVSAQEVVDGCGSVALEVKIVLANGIEGKAVSCHSNRHYHGIAVTGGAPVTDAKGKTVQQDSSAANAGVLPPGASGNVGHPSTARVAVLKTDKIPTTDAKELRRQRFAGNGLLGSVAFIRENIAPALVGLPISSQDEIDGILQSVDGTENFANVGAQCAAAVSMAVAETASKSSRQPAFVQVASNYFSNIGIPRYLSVPTPVVTLFSTEPKWLGKVRVLEVCLVPNLEELSSASSSVPPAGGTAPAAAGNQSPALSNADGSAPVAENGDTVSQQDQSQQQQPTVTNSIRIALDKCMRVLEEAQAKLHEDGHVVVINPDGGLKFNTADSLPALIDYTEECIKEAGFVLGKDFFLALIVDSSFCYKPAPPGTAGAGAGEPAPGKYALVDGQGEMTGGQLAEFFATFIKETKKDKICYLEDPLHDKDANEMKRLMFRLGGTNVAIASNNFTAGNQEKILISAKEKQTNTLVLRMNDCGSISNAISIGQQYQSQYPGAALSVAGEAFLGENSGAFLADFATGVGAKFLRGGGLLRSDHAAVYNRLAEIEEELETLGLAPSSYSSGGVGGGTDTKSTATGLVDFSSLELPPAPTEPVVEVNAKDAKKKR